MILKIKDNADLKELEKFGFKRKKAYDDTYFYEKINLNIEIYIFESRKISISIRYTNGEYITLKIPTVLYDLIQAGLVEKVVDIK